MMETSPRKDKGVDKDGKVERGKEEMERAVEMEKKGESEGRKLDKIDDEDEKERRPRETDFEGEKPSRPIYIKVHRRHASTRTLDMFELPWELSKVRYLAKLVWARNLQTCGVGRRTSHHQKMD